VSWKIAPGLDEVEADERKLKQVIFNLVSNAVKFTPDGGRVKLRARRVDDDVQIDVIDSGVGIAPGDLDHLFDDFRQVGKGGSNNEDGTGLGLAISRHFCRLMGGDLTVESAYGEGSTFTVRLPARMAAGIVPD
jgi:signal transduction histidine kinase